MAGTDEDEYWRLQTAVSNIEIALAKPSVSGDTDVLSKLRTFIQNAKKRIEVLSQDGKFIPDEEKRKKATEELVAVRYLVEKETALNREEKEQYGAFLKEEYFTKADFGSLGTFYENTWDKLSEGGKSQMSHRVWEGVRREEYRFTELPEPVKHKEAERLHEMFVGAKRDTANLERIPERDKNDFVHSWEHGTHSESYQILDRPCFKENVGTDSPRKIYARNAAEEKSQDRPQIANAQQVRAEAPKEPPLKAASSKQLSEDLLGELNAPPAMTSGQAETNTVKR